MADPRPRLPAFYGGLLVVDKPAGWTSHDVVARCRRVFGLRKVGHAGTLDPDATGVLLVGLGTVTRLLRFLSGQPKSYRAEVVLGVATSTLDASGEVTGRWDMGSVTLNDARAATAAFTGTIAQIPPMVSAVHVGGRRLHELAREGIEVERAARTVTVTRFDLDGLVAPSTEGEVGPVFSAAVDCSTGTYIRSLAADLGAALGGGAHLRNLRRTAVGPYTLADAVPLDDISLAAVRPPQDALPGMAAVAVGEPLVAAVGHGKVLAPAELGVNGDGPWAILSPEGRLLAVYQACPDGRVKPAVVLAAADPTEAVDPVGPIDTVDPIGAVDPIDAVGRSGSGPR
ncbi:MAG: tRNA pseudouridine(55) synthase TruB [Actinomycetota bacterium]|nr:tRNA pseudouridine(55) synthase TruB [Actinomycetota bacterium]